MWRPFRRGDGGFWWPCARQLRVRRLQLGRRNCRGGCWGRGARTAQVNHQGCGKEQGHNETTSGHDALWLLLICWQLAIAGNVRRVLHGRDGATRRCAHPLWFGCRRLLPRVGLPLFFGSRSTGRPPVAVASPAELSKSYTCRRARPPQRLPRRLNCERRCTASANPRQKNFNFCGFYTALSDSLSFSSRLSR